MAITKLALQNFRNFEQYSLGFGNKTAIVGENGAGKTNILESIFLLSTGKSMKTSKSEELITIGKDIARIKGKISGKEEEKEILEVVITKGAFEEGGMIKKVPRRKLLIDNTPKGITSFRGKLKTVLFEPQDMELISASPSIRRNFFDTVLSQTDRQYHRSLVSYEKGMRQRNKLLWKLREFGGSRNSLYFWDKLLIKEGNYIADKRQEFIDFLNSQPILGESSYSITYDKSAISETRLAQYEKEEVQAAVTLVGPHRDDAQFIKLNKDLSKFGSRGEQRMAVLWAKLNEIEYIEKISGERPTLLLDDIFSELDHKHRQIVMEVVEKQQTILTTADEHYVEEFSDIDKVQL